MDNNNRKQNKISNKQNLLEKRPTHHLGIPTKAGRYRLFQMLIQLGFNGPKAKLWTSPKSLIDVLTANNFPIQSLLETTLSQLVIEDRGRVITLDTFWSQLEREEKSGIPCWNIFIKTKALTTPRCVARAVSKALFHTTRTIDSTISIRPIESYLKWEKDQRLSLPTSKWYPGRFNQSTVQLMQLLRMGEVKQAIQEAPEKYRVLLESLENLTRSDQSTQEENQDLEESITE